MSETPKEPRSPSLDDYVDGLLDASQHEEFTRKLERDADLRAALALQETIDRSLAHGFEPPGPQRTLAALEAREATTRLIRSPASSFRRLAIAAVVVLAVGGGGWWLHKLTQLPQGDFEYEPHTLAEIYEREVAEGFKPKWVCKDDREFASTFYSQVYQPLLMTTAPANVAAVGLAYCTSLSRETTYLLVRVDSKPVIVFVDRLKAEAQPLVPPDVPSGSGLNRFRRELGSLVLYELTPLDRPQVLDLFYIPENVSEEWLRGGAVGTPPPDNDP